MTWEDARGVGDGPTAGKVGVRRGAAARVGTTVLATVGRTGVTSNGVRVGRGVWVDVAWAVCARRAVAVGDRRVVGVWVRVGNGVIGVEVGAWEIIVGEKAGAHA